jgi:hypothetical protein
MGRNDPYSAFATNSSSKTVSKIHGEFMADLRLPESEQTGSCTVTRKVLR